MARYILNPETGEQTDLEFLQASLFAMGDRYINLISYNGDLVEYIGYALPGTATSAAKWQIRKLTYSGTKVVSITFADANNKFDNIWDNRASITPYG